MTEDEFSNLQHEQVVRWDPPHIPQLHMLCMIVRLGARVDTKILYSTYTWLSPGKDFYFDVIDCVDMELVE